MPTATVRQCAILAGGLGTRLGALTAATPKPILPCGDRPFLAWLMREFLRFGVTEFVLLTGHLSAEMARAADAIRAALPREATITISEEPVRAGTGGALFHARALLAERFLLCNGDSLFDCGIARLLAAAAQNPALGWLVLRRLNDAARFGVVETEGDRVTAFRERPEAGARATVVGTTADGAAAGGAVAGGAVGAVARNSAGGQHRPDTPASNPARDDIPNGAGPGLINGGVYLFDRRVVDHLAPCCSLEAEIMPRLAAGGLLRALEAPGYFRDIGVPADFSRAQTEVPALLRRRALFLDRDGVINVDHGYVGTRERFQFIPGALEAISAATRAGWHVFIVTNQSGVARGLYTEDAVRALLDWIADQARLAGGTVDDVRYCPYHEDAVVPAYRRASDWRKPAPGMLLDLIRAWDLDPARCAMVGDQPSDMEAAAAAGVAGHLFPGGDLLSFVWPILHA